MLLDLTPAVISRKWRTLRRDLESALRGSMERWWRQAREWTLLEALRGEVALARRGCVTALAQRPPFEFLQRHLTCGYQFIERPRFHNFVIQLQAGIDGGGNTA